MGELTLQLAIVFVGRQTINNFQEMILPALMRWWRKRNAGDEYDLDANISPWERDVSGTSSCSGTANGRWLQYFLAPFPEQGMFNEYLELMLQYGYITMYSTPPLRFAVADTCLRQVCASLHLGAALCLS